MTVPLPVPLAPDVMLIQGALLVAVQLQPALLTVTVLLPPAATKFWLVGVRVNALPPPSIRTSAKSDRMLFVDADPVSNIRPSGCTTTSLPMSVPLLKSIVTFPATPKLESRLPSQLYLAIAKSDPVPALLARPAARTRPSDWTVSAFTRSVPVVKSVVSLPSPSNEVSRLPSTL